MYSTYKVHLPYAQSRFVGVRQYSYFSVVLCVRTYIRKFTLGLLQTKHLANGDRWQKSHAVIRTHIFDMICIFSSDRRPDC